MRRRYLNFDQTNTLGGGNSVDENHGGGVAVLEKDQEPEVLSTRQTDLIKAIEKKDPIVNAGLRAAEGFLKAIVLYDPYDLHSKLPSKHFTGAAITRQYLAQHLAFDTLMGIPPVPEVAESTQLDEQVANIWGDLAVGADLLPAPSHKGAEASEHWQLQIPGYEHFVVARSALAYRAVEVSDRESNGLFDPNLVGKAYAYQYDLVEPGSL